MISILIPTFNRAAWMQQAVMSALSQDVEKEILILDRGSTDGTAEVLRTLQVSHPEIRTFHVDGPNLVNSWKYLAQHIDKRSSYINLMPDDDLMWPGGLQSKLTMLQRNPKALFCFSPIDHMDADGTNIRASDHGRVWSRDKESGAAPFAMLFVNNSVPMSTAVFRTCCLDELMRMDRNLLSDWQLWLSISWKGDSAFVVQPTVIQRVHAGQDSLQNGIAGGAFLDNYLQVWGDWLSLGHTPGWVQWEAMRATYAKLAQCCYPSNIEAQDHEMSRFDLFQTLWIEKRNPYDQAHFMGSKGKGEI